MLVAMQTRPRNAYWNVVKRLKNQPWGFHVYAEPSVYWTRYDDQRWTVKDNTFQEITEHDFTHRYALSLSNNKLDIWGFVPTMTVSYTRRESNIWQREYDKTAIEFTMQQRF